MVASRIEQSEEMHYLSWLRTIIFGQWGLLGISACRLAVCHKGCKTGWSTYSSPILRTSKSPQPVPTSSSFISSVLFTTVAPHARAILLLSDLRVRLNTLIPKQSRKRSRYQKKRHKQHDQWQCLYDIQQWEVLAMTRNSSGATSWPHSSALHSSTVNNLGLSPDEPLVMPAHLMRYIPP